MNPPVKSGEALAGYQLKLLFGNGETRIFDVTPYLDKGIFRQLREENYFRQVRTAFGSVQWPMNRTSVTIPCFCQAKLRWSGMNRNRPAMALERSGFRKGSGVILKSGFPR
jgi:hypothetical protein